MPDICVIFASEDKDVVGKLVVLLGKHWNVWWSEDIAQGDWRDEVRNQMRDSMAVVPVLSRHTDAKDIFKDEFQYAKDLKRLLFPFLIDKIVPPLGFGGLNRTRAFGWQGDENHPGFQELKKKIAAKVAPTRQGDNNLKRIQTLQLGNKTLKLPSFVFSLSSHETQIRPKDGVRLFVDLLNPAAGLVSAYDAWSKHRHHVPGTIIKELINKESVVFLDSGNYEASRKNDYHSRENEEGWCREHFLTIINKVSPDIAFSFDHPNPRGTTEEIAKRIIKDYRSDKRAIGSKAISLIPIVHLPSENDGNVGRCASEIARRVAQELDPLMVAIPERELGNGLFERFATIRHIRKELNRLGKYFPLHLLGTGNPVSMIAFAVAGADGFDGLEWCRTAVNYDNGYLFHFQQFDCFKDLSLGRVQQKFRVIIENQDVPYAVRVLCCNFDYFTDLTRDIQRMIHSGQEDILLKSVPHIGAKLFEVLKK